MPINPEDQKILREHLDNIKSQLTRLGPNGVMQISNALNQILEHPESIQRMKEANVGFLALLAECQLQQLVLELNTDGAWNQLKNTIPAEPTPPIVPNKQDVKELDMKLDIYKIMFKKMGPQGTYPIAELIYDALENPSRLVTARPAFTKLILSIAHCVVVKMLYEINLETIESN